MGEAYFKTRNQDEDFNQNETLDFPMHRVNIEEAVPTDKKGKRGKFRSGKSFDNGMKNINRSKNQTELD